MATSLEKLENEVQIHHLHVEHFHTVKRLRKSVLLSGDKCASFLSVSYLTFTNQPCQLWSYWTEFHEIFTQYRGVIYAVNAYIEIAIAHYFSEWQSNKCRGVRNFASFLPLNWLPWQRPLRYRKKKVGLIICNSIPTIRCKDCENRSIGSSDTSAPSAQVRYDTKLVAMATSLEDYACFAMYANTLILNTKTVHSA